MTSVLVVDDDFRVASVHASYASSVEGLEVVAVAHTAADALRAVSELKPDLILLDNYLPDQPGLEVCAELAGRGCDVMMVTADGSADSVRAALSAGAVNYVLKPFGADQLVRRLKAWQRYRGRVRDGLLDQDQIDTAMRALHEGDRPQAPKGQSPVTASLVRNALEAASGPVSAADLGTELGIARATAQRYLAGLVEEGVAVMRLRYGGTGRPEHEYLWRH
ncbi:transcriptional regulatory protein [Flexivirga endophytica]|uniref:Transcriptional regulatory protein n=1 Tax=Flexivirga endophytica TaxID=1849103 RepID=A0A916T218_9MICO|nr:response regulator [Flexivirga endophytica]GGB28909.1 transcriptional regulatory protein [Flexivirga endophytica]GHB49946.1 transcriptional regulatory protein [Flexivirga endophytica]